MLSLLNSRQGFRERNHKNVVSIHLSPTGEPQVTLCLCLETVPCPDDIWLVKQASHSEQSASASSTTIEPTVADTVVWPQDSNYSRPWPNTGQRWYTWVRSVVIYGALVASYDTIPIYYWGEDSKNTTAQKSLLGFLQIIKGYRVAYASCCLQFSRSTNVDWMYLFRHM